MSFIAKTVLGVMSGTSLDGVDLALVHFEKKKTWQYKLLKVETVSYPPFWQNCLQELTTYKADVLHQLDLEYTTFLGKIVLEFLARHSITDLDFVSSHGHTALHEPQKGTTYQLGNLPQLAKIIGHKVICDFRISDVALGGQGAPLVPGGEVHLFANYAACVNLGGFANITRLDNDRPLAYDITAVNVVLNHLSQRKGMTYDEEGNLAQTGKLIDALLQSLNKLPFYTENPPKSLGKEWVEQSIFPLLTGFNDCKVEDLLHTFCHHCAHQIVRALPQKGKVLFTGGGAFNTFLVSIIKEKSTCEIYLPSSNIIEFKEALIFAFLGVLREMNQNNCLASVTGAPFDHSSGKIFLP